MDELGRCFVCLMTIRPGREVAAKARTAVPVWVDRVICTPCAYRVKQLGEIRTYQEDEWWTIRLDGSGAP